ncbi:CAPA peptides-like isoform X1 [Hylaeus volcanicus]|uniref:CAPA peptides-like isoform X1 n=1 Tax=Hylaeus volcanicus TaxID=313075 RepID=UPI0023B877F8|nr:CAPA peptides-like isoform X1 [Hylaeus volcanicus]
MTNHLFVFLVVLIFSTSLNLPRCSLGQHLDSARDGDKVKANNRRASGLVPYPRIGRSSEMAGFTRLDRAAGLVQYPRVGRADLPISNVNFNRYHDMEPDTDFQFYNVHDMDLDSAPDRDYEGYAGRSMNFKNKNLKDAAWLIPNRLHMKEQRPPQKIDENRSLYSDAQVAGLRNGQTSLNDYTPRLGRETNVERGICK